MIERRQAAALAVVGAWLAARPAVAQQGEQQAVARAVDALTAAMLQPDRAKLEALTVAGLSYGHSAGKIENRQQFIDALVNKTSVFRSITLQDQSISVAGNNAIVRHLLVGETMTNNQPAPVRIGVMQVWTKEGSDWKLLARQAYRV
ncbi:nuclear transport factor 2 family protein [Siccirubricoccus sp. KC 17139]|uniref:Nuclear transport factor 2 family protein n=1 Tax=Siccirubricoccus soli TaxID=2899147 RepID=A0ABT1D1G0_9PROT|nr:nuclear transport factor 2 family protein [Siccirubricoccus soli]MCO6415722.1 nuclear transport factor 2 family protein [Siccirubricoccus soli]MCP2681854.1 nuclear transport factor 2 family protein [Siccirubricoccus soli]